MEFNTNYYHMLDRDYFTSPVVDVMEEPSGPQEITTESGKSFTAKLGPKELGKPGSPMQHQLQALLANIREGVGSIEFNFPGAGKGTQQAPTPESYNKLERQEMRDVVNINKLKTSVHATFGRQGFSGLTERGFNDAVREDNLKEIKKAIDFAADATKGGAIVFHTGEWNRPITELNPKWNEIIGQREVEEVDPETGKKVIKKMNIYKFEGYPEEQRRATLYVADPKTGGFVDTISKDQYLYEPEFITAIDEEAEKFGVKKVGGKLVDSDGKPLKKDDWIDMEGKKINAGDDPERLFKRIPKYQEDKINFAVKKLTWDNIVDRSKKIEEETHKYIAPEVLFARIHLETRALQAKGSSLFHAREYDELKKQRDALLEARKVWEELEPKLENKNEIWKHMLTEHKVGGVVGNLIPPDVVSPLNAIKDALDRIGRNMRFIHESSSSADTQAQEYEELAKRVKPVRDVGVDKSADSIARAGIMAMEKYNQNKKEMNEPLYISPENWHYTQYGSHPEELIELITESRKKMKDMLVRTYGYSEREAAEKANTHIKATVDVSHLNMWRQHFQAKPGESAEGRDQRFKDWLVEQTRRMAKEKILGHVHLSDNLGFDDEHLTPGTGNVPMKELVEELTKAGIKDFIIEPGAFNYATVMHDTFSFFGSPIYKLRPTPNFGSIQRAHFGYHNAAMYIVGAYAPSNEWVFWSEVPME